MTVKLKNNVVGYLSAAISAADLSFDLQAGNGANFPSLGSGEYFYATLVGSGGAVEIVKVTARSTDTFTVVRGQDDTTAASFAASSRVELRVTALSVLDAASDAANAILPLGASDVSIVDAGGYYTGSTVEAALQETALAENITLTDTGGYYTGTDVDTALQEVGASLATKLALDGSSTMTGAIKAANGSAASPSITFGSDTNTGFYRKAADTIGVATNGVEVLEISPTGTNIVPTGVMMPYVAGTSPTGWVRANGQTIGDASSGATERANADTLALYTLIYNNYGDGICPVAGGRGASAAADFANHKAITLPDLRGRAFFGLDDMGNAGGAASRLGVVMTSPTTNGASGGTETHTLVANEVPAHTHTFSGNTNTTGAHTHSPPSGSFAIAGTTGGTTSGGGILNITSTSQTASAGDHFHTFSGTTASYGGGAAHTNMPPAWLTTYIIKL